MDVCTIAPNDKLAYDSDTSEDMRIALRTVALNLQPSEAVLADIRAAKSEANKTGPGTDNPGNPKRHKFA